jgi:proline iminopeptidase
LAIRSDPQAVAEYYRVHFGTTLRQAGHLEQVVARLRARSTPEGLLKAWATEAQLMSQTLGVIGHDLLPHLRRLRLPALLIHGEYDFIPVELAAHIAEALPGARMVVLRECGHFTYLERPEEVRKELVAFLADYAAPG